MDPAKFCQSLRNIRTERETFPLNLATGKAEVTWSSLRGLQVDSHVAQAHFRDPIKDVIKLPRIIN